MPVKKHEKTPELVDEILAQMVEGKSLTAICKQKGMPSVGTVYRWMAEDEELSEGYARATQARARTYAERMEDVVNQALSGEIRSDAARVAVDAYKWITSKLLVQYADRQTVDVNVQHTHSLHHEALKRLTERASGTDVGYIDADYQEIPKETKALSKSDTIDDILRASDPEPKTQGNPGSQGSEVLETPRGVDHPAGAAAMATPAPATQHSGKKPPANKAHRPPTPRSGGKRKASTK